MAGDDVLPQRGWTVHDAQGHLLGTVLEPETGDGGGLAGIHLQAEDGDRRFLTAEHLARVADGRVELAVGEPTTGDLPPA